MVRRSVRHHAGKFCQPPAVPSTPEHLFTVAFALIKESAIAVKQSLLFIVQVVRCLPPEPVHEIGMTTVARGARGKREGRRSHEQSVAPDPFARWPVIRELE